MSAKPTPGPWKVGKYSCSGGWCVHVDAGDRGRGIDVVDGVAGLTDEQQLANARLIAAAPDLLQALQDIINVWDSDSYAFGISKARVAIAKATGGQL